MTQFGILRVFLPVLFVWAFINMISAQNTPLYFESYTTENGLPQNLIGKIVQDKTGFIWMITGHGMARFDGYNFVNFNHEIADTNSLPADFLTDIVVDSKNGLWIATFGKGLVHYKPEKNLFFRFNDETNSSARHLQEILSLYLDKSNYLWIGSTDGLFRSKMDVHSFFDDTAAFKNKFLEYKSTSEKLKINCIYEDDENNIWVGSDEGLFNVNLENKGYNPILLSKKSITINVLTAYNNNNLLLGTNKGLYKYNKITKQSQNLLDLPVFNNLSSDTKIERIFVDKEENLWIGTYGKGLILYQPKDNLVYQYKRNSYDEYSLRDNVISAIFIDRANTLFVGLRLKGLNVAKIRKNHFSRFRSEESKSTISNNIIWSMHAVSNNYVWVCTQNGLNKFNIETGKSEQFFINDKNRAGSSNFLMLSTNHPDYFILNSLGKGLVKFDKKSGSFEEIPWGRTENSYVNFITALHEKNDTTVWIASWGKGIIEYNTKEKRANIVSGLPNNFIRSIYRDTQNRIWLCTWGSGLLLYNNENQHFTSFTNTDGLNSDYIYCLYEDSDGYLWLGTSSGLTKFDPETKRVSMIHSQFKAVNEEVYTILEDEGNNLWVGTNNGLYKINKSNGQFINFNTQDGIQSNEFNQHACAKTPDGFMLFGGVNGFNYFHPDSITQSNFKPQMVISGISLFYKNYKKGDKYKDRILLNKAIEYTDTIFLNHNENIIELNFSSLDYYESSEIKYTYRLLGFEEKWVSTSAKKRFASYTNLSPGNYIFQLKSTNSDGVWNDNIKQVHIIIEPAFWQQSWFRLLILLAIFLLIFSFIKLRIRWALIQQNKLKELVKAKTKSIRSKNEELNEQTEELNQLTELLKDSNKDLEQKVRKRTKRLKKALDGSKEAEKLISSFLSNLSHEIRTPMNAINGFSQLISDQDLTDEQRSNYGDIINKNVDSLLVLIDNIMSISKLHTGHYVIKNSTFVLNDLFQELYIEFKNIAQIIKHDVDFKLLISSNDKNLTIYSDRDIFKQIIYQLVDNAIKYTDKGSISFGFTTEPPKMELEKPQIFKTITSQNRQASSKQSFKLAIYVKDTGVGIDKKQQKNIFAAFKKVEGKEKLFRGTGLGLAIVKNLTEKLFGEISLESQSDVGTTITISIPLSGN